jgi:hypothetical protein
LAIKWTEHSGRRQRIGHADYSTPWVETADLRERLDSMVKVVRLILDEDLHGDIARRLYKEVT